MAPLSSATRLRVRPPWWVVDLRPTRRSVVVCALLPVVAFVPGLIAGMRLGGVVAVGVVVVSVLVRWVRVPLLRITDDAVEMYVDDEGTQHLLVPAGPGGAGTTAAGARASAGGPGSWWGTAPVVRLPVDRILDVTLCRRRDADAHIEAGADEVDAYLAYRRPHADLDDIDALQVTVRRHRGDRQVLLPVWRPWQARRLLRAVVRATGRLDEDTISRTWPDSSPRWAASLREALRTEGGRLVGAALLAGTVVLAAWQVLRLVRAATLDTLLGTAIGTAVRLTSTLVLTAGTAAVLAGLVVTALSLVVWRRAGRPVALSQALELGWLRGAWAVWQLRVWLGGVALLFTVAGVGTARYAAGYALASGAVPVLQVVHQVTRRGVEEALTSSPPPLERVAHAHQWIAGLAALALYLFWMLF